jgi:hypothetical protein
MVSFLYELVLSSICALGFIFKCWFSLVAIWSLEAPLANSWSWILGGFLVYFVIGSRFMSRVSCFVSLYIYQYCIGCISIVLISLEPIPLGFILS